MITVAQADAVRERLLRGLSGEVIEIGAGWGQNFAHYPPAVTRLTAVEPAADRRAQAMRAAACAAIPIEVVDGRAEHLAYPDTSFDAAVVSLVLCSVADENAALAQVHRVLRAGGRLHFYEHVLALSPGVRHLQRLLDLRHRAGAGCHAARDISASITNSGFTIREIDRFSYSRRRLPLPSLISPRIVGVALRETAPVTEGA